ncbi:hypothetical protein IWW36_002958 [Coemansia brasiliensis]|uniref:Uncharacterized protein n=1 Tax=Coemansia brasiliensis TaxID=2650707 RepID=A0A9W8I680_9FUNG|nr:hypothetical protein IWW36_002958 [Coemansia brasiliensis]
MLSTPRPAQQPEQQMPTSETQAPVQAYAKLEGPGFCYYVRTLDVTLGRSSGAGVDIALGDSKAVSRRHAKIQYNFLNQSFELQVLGKNGCLVDDQYYARGQGVALRHRMVVQIGDTEFTFLLPRAAMPAPAPKLAAMPAEPHGTCPVSAITPQRLNLYPPVRHASEHGSPDPLPGHEPPTQELPVHELSAAPEPPVHEPLERGGEPPAPLTFGNTGSTAGGDSSTADSTAGRGEVRILPATERPAKEPQRDTYAKPTYSYASLIAQAINSTAEAKITLSGIYAYIMANYPYYKHAQNGWQNSIRHNLSLNKAFVRVQRASNEPGKGSYWAIDDAYKGQFANGVYKRTRRTKKAMELERASRKRPAPADARASKRLSAGAHSAGEDTVGYASAMSNATTPAASPSPAPSTPPQRLRPQRSAAR